MKTKYCSYKWSDERNVTNSQHSLIKNVSADMTDRDYNYLHFSANNLNFPNVDNTTGIILIYLRKERS